MSLTATDLKQIQTSVAGVVDPKFDQVNNKLELRFGQIKNEIDNLTSATNRKFHAVFTDITVVREDLHIVKQLVTEHGFRIAQLEHKPTKE